MRYEYNPIEYKQYGINMYLTSAAMLEATASACALPLRTLFPRVMNRAYASIGDQITFVVSYFEISNCYSCTSACKSIGLRQIYFAAVMCPEGQVYRSCEAPQNHTCHVSEIGLQENLVVEGCFCPEGTVLDGKQFFSIWGLKIRNTSCFFFL